MYNRYIPGPDGSYQRSRVQDSPGTGPGCSAAVPPGPSPTSSSEGCSRPPKPVSSILNRILPGGLDTGDLIVLLLLLLIAGDDDSSGSQALLTLILYLVL